MGEIHACPTCGSRVQIRPPAEGQAQPALSTPGSVSIEIGAVALPTFDDVAVAMVDSQPQAPAELVESQTPVAAATGGWSAIAWWGIPATALLVTGGLAAAIGGALSAVATSAMRTRST